MKDSMKKIAAAVAAVAAANGAYAACATTGALAGACNTGSTATGVVAMAVVANCNVVGGMQEMQGMDAACFGNTSKLCAPNISSAELRAILTGDVGNTANISSSDSASSLAATLAAASGSYAACTTAATTGGNSDMASQGRESTLATEARTEFTGVGFLNGSTKDVVTVLSNLGNNARHRFGIVEATALDDDRIGFVKLDGSAPDLANTISSNYNLVANLYGTIPAAAQSVDAKGTIFGAYVAAGGDMAGDGVAYHNNGGNAANDLPIAPNGGSAADTDQTR
jgi:hypothetical protein